MSAVPTKPGWWWRRAARGAERFTAPVDYYAIGEVPKLCWRDDVGEQWLPVEADGRWIREIPSPERLAALEQCAKILERHVCLDFPGCEFCKALAALREAEA